MIVWIHGSVYFNLNLGYHNNIYETGTMGFAMQVPINEEPKFLDQKCEMANGEISVNVFLKQTNSYLTSNTC